MMKKNDHINKNKFRKIKQNKPIIISYSLKKYSKNALTNIKNKIRKTKKLQAKKIIDKKIKDVK